MKTIGLVIAMVFWSALAPAMSFWTALANIESDNNDYAVGSVGEISRYQIRPEVWQTYSSSKRYTDPNVALPIAEKYMAKLKRDFARATGREASEEDCVILWKSGISGYERRGFHAWAMSVAHQDRITRFRNLRTYEVVVARTSPQKPAAAVANNPKPIDLSGLQNFFMLPSVDKPVVAPVFGKTVTTDASGSLFTLAENASAATPGVTLFLR